LQEDPLVGHPYLQDCPDVFYPDGSNTLLQPALSCPGFVLHMCRLCAGYIPSPYRLGLYPGYTRNKLGTYSGYLPLEREGIGDKGLGIRRCK
jgi:hypothetical protein